MQRRWTRGRQEWGGRGGGKDIGAEALGGGEVDVDADHIGVDEVLDEVLAEVEEPGGEDEEGAKGDEECGIENSECGMGIGRWTADDRTTDEPIEEPGEVEGREGGVDDGYAVVGEEEARGGDDSEEERTDEGRKSKDEGWGIGMLVGDV